MTPDLEQKLAQAFGAASPDEWEACVARLRAGDPTDFEALRLGFLTLLDAHRGGQSARAHHDHGLAQALKASNLGRWEWDLTTGKVFVDRTYFGFLGLDRDDAEILVEELVGLVHPADSAPFAEATREALRGRAPLFHAQHRMRHADGRWVWLETFGKVTQRDANGRARRLSGTHANITERKQLERALSNTLRVMKTLLETLPLPVVIRDAERRVTLVNAAYEKMSGRGREELAGEKLDGDAAAAHPAALVDSDDEVLTHKRSMNFEASIRGAEGREISVLIAKTPLLAEDGTVTGIASVLTDISDQKRIERILERARSSAEAAVQAKSRFLANMSHELRTPLNGVVGMASLLENTALDAKQRRFVRTLRSSAEALITLINDVLDLSKAEAGKLELTPAPFELRREIEQTVGLFAGRAHDKGIEIAAHIGRGVPHTIIGDSIRLRQIIGNLVNNAVKFTESGAVLLAVTVVDATGPDVQLEFSVTDTGVGVDPQEQQRIFEAFEQADGSVTRRFGGTGLGLAISRQLVDLMRGTMGLESTPGKGSRFSFRVPTGIPRSAAMAPTPANDVAGLVIGLHPLIRGAVRDTLCAEVSRVVTVNSTLEAIQALDDVEQSISHLRIVIDSNAVSKLEQAVSGLRAAAGPRSIEVITLLPPDADATPLAGVQRSLVTPLCTPDLLASSPIAESGQTSRLRALPAAGSRGRALVVEDNAVNLEMARAMLDMMGFQVATASNGREGVAAAAADPKLDLILMDCQMPVMDGLAAARAIRAAEQPGMHIPIVALTGNAMAGDRERCIAAGMDDYLAKPFSLSALKAVVDRWAGQRAADAGAARAGSR